MTAMSYSTPLAMQALAVDATLVSVTRGLADVGVDAILLKGVSFERWIYDAEEPRPSGDVDLLVAPAQRVAAEVRLKELGFVNKYDGASPDWAEEHADVWSPTGAFMPVDLHRRLWGVELPAALAWRRLLADSTTIDVGDWNVRVMSEPGRALVVALHAAHHGPGFERAYVDLERALDRVDRRTWEAARLLARDLRALPGFSAGLTLVPRGERLRDSLGLAPADRDVVVRRASMWAEPATADGFLRVMDAPTARGKLDVLVRELVPSRAFMTARAHETELSRRQLGRAYLSRWASLVHDAPHGLRAARAIRRRRK